MKVKGTVGLLLTVMGLAVIGDEMVSTMILAAIGCGAAGWLLKELSEHNF